MRKHGRDAFSIHALLSDVQTRPELDKHERDFIDFLKSQDPEYGYNIARGGEGGGMLGHKHSPETIEKIRRANKGKQQYPRTPENEIHRIANWQQALTDHGGSFQTPESVEKIRVARAAQDEVFRAEKQKEYERLHPERRQRASAAHRGKKHTMSLVGATKISITFQRIAHNRWHVSRGVSNPSCKLCSEA